MRERRHDYHDRSPVPVRVYGRRTVEALGYSTFGLADHFVRPFAPLIAGQAVADATTTPAEHLNDFADRIAMVTERMGGARVAFDPEDLRKSPIVAVGSLDDVCGKLVGPALGLASATSRRRSTHDPRCSRQ